MNLDEHDRAGYAASPSNKHVWGRPKAECPSAPASSRTGRESAAGATAACKKGTRRRTGKSTRCAMPGGAPQYAEATLYSTLAPCAMCSGSIILFGIRGVVVGENAELPRGA